MAVRRLLATYPRRAPPKRDILPRLSCFWPALVTMSTGVAPAAEPGFVSVTDEMLEEPAIADWPSFRRTTNSWGFSPLTEITRKNVANLALVWSRPMAEGIQEASPLVYN